MQDFAIDSIDSNSIAPVALLRPQAFSLVPRPSAPAASPSAAVVDIPSGWEPPPPLPSAATARPDTFPALTASPLKVHGRPSVGMYTLQAFGGHSAAVADLAPPRPGPAAHVQPGSGSVAAARAVAAAGGEWGHDESSEFPESEEHTAAAVSAALEQLNAGVASHRQHHPLYIHVDLMRPSMYTSSSSVYSHSLSTPRHTASTDLHAWLIHAWRQKSWHCAF